MNASVAQLRESDPIIERLEDQLGWYDRKSLGNQRAYKRIKIAEILAAAIIPFCGRPRASAHRHRDWRPGCFDHGARRPLGCRTGKTLPNLRHNDLVYDMAWSPDGKRLVTASGDQTKVWDTQTGQELLSLRGHNDSVFAIAWSPDSKRLASAGADEVVQVYATDIRDLMALARERIGVHPSDEACKRYLHVEKCPSVPDVH